MTSKATLVLPTQKKGKKKRKNRWESKQDKTNPVVVTAQNANHEHKSRARKSRAQVTSTKIKSTKTSHKHRRKIGLIGGAPRGLLAELSRQLIRILRRIEPTVWLLSAITYS
ncbi:hypothetical protein J6590_025228 [Homalodisca vitripennis]|nr:hypothetical protein J6590_025228 [Homalodisca vitripennis]